MRACACTRARALARAPARSVKRLARSDGLPAHHEPRGREDALGAAPRQADSTGLQHDLRLHRPVRHRPEPLEEVQDHGHQPEHDRVELEPGPLQWVPRGRERHVPGLPASLGAVDGAVARLQHLEACVLEGLGADGGVHEVGQAVADLDVPLDLPVVGRGGVVAVRQAPLVAREDGSGLEHAEDLAVDLRAVGCVARGLDRVDAVEGRVREGQLHEVSLDKLHLAAHALAGGNGVASVHLELVDGDCLDLSASEAGDVPRRPADPAAAVQDLGALADAQAAGEVVLVPEDGLAEGLPGAAVREVEARAPAPLVELRRQVVIGVHQSSIL
mmetsp:Transcript_41931/g.131056  ORF Transcript_41931/g.131056 Transcript_41931/m.131056 type:complete len:330 (-) Transcript_41931:365-1354(-)